MQRKSHPYAVLFCEWFEPGWMCNYFQQKIFYITGKGKKTSRYNYITWRIICKYFKKQEQVFLEHQMDLLVVIGDFLVTLVIFASLLDVKPYFLLVFVKLTGIKQSVIVMEAW